MDKTSTRLSEGQFGIFNSKT